MDVLTLILPRLILSVYYSFVDLLTCYQWRQREAGGGRKLETGKLETSELLQPLSLPLIHLPFSLDFPCPWTWSQLELNPLISLSRATFSVFPSQKLEHGYMQRSPASTFHRPPFAAFTSPQTLPITPTLPFSCLELHS